jgi:hypothetical protein
MKRASKKRVKQIRNKAREVLKQLATAYIPEDQQTPGNMKTVDELIQFVLKNRGNDISEHEADEIEARVKIAPFHMRRQLAETVKALPHFPGGQKSKLTEEQRRGMIDDIASFVRNGLELRGVKDRAARKYAVSISTVQRVWRNRAKIPDDKS